MGDCYLGDVLRVTAILKYEDLHHIQNVWFLKMTEGDPVADSVVTLAIATWLDGVYANVVPDIATSVHFSTIEFYNLTQDRPMVGEDWPTLNQGTGAGLADALQLAGQVNFRTGVKRAIGKKYIGGYTDASISSGGYLNPAPIANLEAFGADACANVAAGLTLWVCGHVRQSNGLFLEWLDAYAKPVVATQRKRKLGTGV